MRNIFRFLRHYSNLMLFVLLQVLCLSLLVTYNKSHRAAYLEMSYGITGKINAQAHKLESYFSLGENNQKLAKENTDLKNQLPQNFVTINNTGKIVVDSTVKWDSTGKQRKYFYRNAAVVGNSIALQENYIMIERGKNQGIEKDMAVTSAGGIVGVVVANSERYAMIMSLLNRNMHVSVMLKNGKLTGALEWDGKSPILLQMKGIPKSTVLAKGDTVLTSNDSYTFPPSLMVGTIEKIEKEEAGNNYLLQIKPGANFQTLQFVDVVENLFLKEQKELDAKVKQVAGSK